MQSALPVAGPVSAALRPSDFACLATLASTLPPRDQLPALPGEAHTRPLSHFFLASASLGSTVVCWRHRSMCAWQSCRDNVLVRRYRVRLVPLRHRVGPSSHDLLPRHVILPASLPARSYLRFDFSFELVPADCGIVTDAAGVDADGQHYCQDGSDLANVKSPIACTRT